MLKIPIAQRLAIGFLIPALMAAIALGSVSVRSQQLLVHESSFYQSLVDGYTSLGTANQILQQMHTNILGTLNDASKPQPPAETMREDYTTLHRLSTRYANILDAYERQNILERSPELANLFAEAGDYSQIVQQNQYAKQAEKTWQIYSATQQQILNTLDMGNVARAHALELSLAEPAYANAMGTLLQLAQFNGNMIPSVRAAATVEVNQLLLTTALAALCIVLGIGIVGWLVFSTVVRRLQKTQRIVQAIEGGQMEVRLPTEGRDEIARVSGAVNGMLDNIVGLLEETRQQRDELADAEVLKNLHEQLQREHDALNEANARLAALATIDPLTGLPNHQRVMNRIEEELSRCQRTQGNCAILFIDLDHFKRINDTWGHRAGDMVLHETAQRLVHTLRLEDFVGRYGGEEFAIVLSLTDLEAAKHVAERIRHALAGNPFLWETDEAQSTITIPVTASIGIAISPEHGNTRATLIEAADTAMYHAKHAGRNRACVAGEEQIFVHELLTTANAQAPDRAALQALVAAVQAFDKGTSTHAKRMVQLSEATAQRLGCAEEEQHLVSLAALLHDVGKIGIPHEILQKPGPLTEDEWAVMRNHPGIGRQILQQAGGKCALLSHIVVAHHERWDGSGYPYGLCAEAIPLGARILSVVDSYDAMTSDRPYREAMPEAVAQAELQQCSGSQFDPQVVAALLSILEDKERTGVLEENQQYMANELTNEAGTMEAEPTLAVG
ncbi:MAG TPA: diguanylate cyclase [Ktedonobacteraceae bacterium]|nr:diguanylate cyclase [Ktedonobacteraceae bacterium]